MAEPRSVDYGGRCWTLTELAGYARIDRRTLQSRLDRGMSVVDAISRTARDYPRGVKRSREAGARPFRGMVRHGRTCDRCGVVAPLQKFAEEWSLCTLCAMHGSIHVRSFVLRQS